MAHTLPSGPGEAPVGKLDGAIPGAFSAKAEVQFRAGDLHVVVLESGQTEGIVLFGVLVVAHADEAGLK